MNTLAFRGPFHFIGIGGAGMSPLAEILRAQGQAVSGSDEKASLTTERLSARGIRIQIGHCASNIAGARSLIASSAIKDDNPELAEARRAGLQVIHRGDLLDEVMAPFSHRIAISGSHGKTTTTAMVTHVLAAAGFDPMALVGGKLKGTKSGARLGEGDTFVAEADESDRSFLRLHPTMCLVTNIDREHLDTYRDLDDVETAFERFAQGVPASGIAVLCADDPAAGRIAARIKSRACTYGRSLNAHVRGAVDTDGSGFPVVSGRGPLGDFAFTLGVGGEMNAINAIGAMAVAQSLGIAQIGRAHV